MSRYFPKGQYALNILWHLTKPDGTPFNLEGYDYVLKYKSGRGETVVTTSQISGADQNIVSFILTEQQQLYIGAYSLSLNLIQNNNTICRLKYQDAFLLTSMEDYNCPLTESQGNTDNPQIIELFSAAEFYLFQPIIPVIGSNGNWFVNGTDTGKSSHATIRVVEEGPNRGRIIFEEGTESEQVYDGIRDILNRADEDHTRAGNDHEQAGTDHTQAASDHVQAETDHTRAGTDHEQALTDHQMYLDDHAVVQGYEERLEKVEENLDLPISEDEYDAMAEAGTLEEKYYFVTEE